MNWSFDIFPRNNYMSSFIHTKSDDFVINERSGEMPYCFFMASKHFDKSSNPFEVYFVASFFIRILNAYSLIVHESKRDFEIIHLGPLFNENNGEKLTESEFVGDIDFNEIDRLLAEIDLTETSEVSKLMKLALKPGFIRNLMLIIGTEMSFANMYSALDEIKHFLEGKESINNLVNKNELKRFTHTSNNYKALGFKARHGTTRHDPPSNPMGIEEAHTLISNLIIQILAKYFNLNFEIISNQEIDFSTLNLFDDEE